MIYCTHCTIHKTTIQYQFLQKILHFVLLYGTIKNAMVIYYDFGNATYTYTHNLFIRDEDFFTHHHTVYELIFVIRGKGSVVIGTHSYQFSNNTVIIIPPEKFHVMNVSKEDEYERVVINFKRNQIPLGMDIDRTIVNAVSEPCREILMKMVSYQTEYDAERFDVLMQSLFREFLVVFEKESEHTELPRTKLPKLVTDAINYVRDNLSSPLTVDQIADALFVSRSHLNHKFKEHTYLGIKNYIRIQKMMEARKLLHQGILPGIVATELGYTTYTTFLRNYQAEFGCTPKNMSRKKDLLTTTDETETSP